MEQLRKERTADERYPGAMARLRRLLDASSEAPLADQLREFLNRVALSRSDAAEKDPDLAFRVNLLTLHSTKGLGTRVTIDLPVWPHSRAGSVEHETGRSQ